MSDLVQIGKIHFRFACQPGCTNCCTQPGEVYLTLEDAGRVAAFLNMTEPEFRTRYCELDADGDLRLTTPAEKACHFLAGEGCTIHEAKPLQCRTFPFWPENVKTPAAWKKVSRHCPGIGVGPVLPADRIRAEAQACKNAFPDF